MKTILLLFVCVFSACTAASQTICDSVNIEPDTVYINQSVDTVFFDTLIYSGQSDISYSKCYYSFSDTSYMDIKESAYTHGISGPFVFTKWNGYRIIYNTANIPANTIVNAQYGVYHPGIAPSDPAIIDCLLPVTFIINGTTGIEAVRKKNRIKIFPMPFSVQTTLQTDRVLNDATLTVYSASGQIVTRIENISTQTITFFRNNLPGGLYYVCLTQDCSVIARDKLIITDQE